ncbi:iron ABC transporter permease [Pilimelia columellifera]|uniref:Iron ABC transporter permease n=1 Tax=Pilimelia columellifera subsp. columellifera TaxID=706583 RepID=A0ABN3NI66_9ACTN
MAPRPALLLASTAAVAVGVLPLLYLAVRAHDAGWERILDEIATARTLTLSLRSVALAGVVTAASVVAGLTAAYLVTRTDLPGRRAFGVLAALPLAVPTYVAAFAWTSTIDGFAGFWAAALVLTLACYPYVYLPVAAALAGADPAAEEVARSLGRGPWQVFVGVTLRLARPALAAGALLVALYVFSDFGAVSLLRVDTFTRAIFTAFSLGFDSTGALVLSTVLVALTALLVGGELATRARGARYARLAGSARPQTRIRLGRWRWSALAASAALAALALGVPAFSLLRWSVAGVSRPGTIAEIGQAAGASLAVAAAGAGLTVLLALPVGLLSARAPGVVATVLDRITYLAHALPGLVIGLSLVYFGINVAYPLYQTVWLLALAYATLFLPLAVGSIASAAGQSPPRLEEVARSLGRGPWAVLRTVTLPLTLPGVGAAAALVFLAGMKELPATLLLRPTGMDTLATQLWTQTAVSAYAAAAPYAALLVALSAIPTWVLAARTGVLERGAA